MRALRCVRLRVLSRNWCLLGNDINPVLAQFIISFVELFGDIFELFFKFGLCLGVFEIQLVRFLFELSLLLGYDLIFHLLIDAVEGLVGGKQGSLSGIGNSDNSI